MYTNATVFFFIKTHIYTYKDARNLKICKHKCNTQHTHVSSQVALTYVYTLTCTFIHRRT